MTCQMRTSQGPGGQDLWLILHDSEVAGAILDIVSSGFPGLPGLHGLNGLPGTKGTHGNPGKEDPQGQEGKHQLFQKAGMGWP